MTVESSPPRAREARHPRKSFKMGGYTFEIYQSDMLTSEEADKCRLLASEGATADDGCPESDATLGEFEFRLVCFRRSLRRGRLPTNADWRPKARQTTGVRMPRRRLLKQSLLIEIQSIFHRSIVRL